MSADGSGLHNLARVKAHYMSTTSTPPAQIVRGEQAAHAHARVVAAVPPHERCDYEYDTPQEVIHFDNDLRDAGVIEQHGGVLQPKCGHEIV